MRTMVKLGGVLVGTAALVSPVGFFADGAGAQVLPRATLTIEKEVDGLVPADTEFTVTVDCGGPNIVTPKGNVTTAKVDFDSEGEPDGSSTITLVPSDGNTCTVTETEDGDAEDVSYECESNTPDPRSCSSHGPQEDPITVRVLDSPSEGQRVTVTVTNEFPDPEEPAPAPQPVTVAPTFTG